MSGTKLVQTQSVQEGKGGFSSWSKDSSRRARRIEPRADLGMCNFITVRLQYLVHPAADQISYLANVAGLTVKAQPKGGGSEGK
ncbi:hypothetical protein HYFRA_00009566 [Hymenoscyphus fraxineus]|uniref:Uncharacterized protein n=1 Tax=Hymenoscyphus fraxineus TaxID=746836 RepID=A0A9N9PVH9_9HELO|nr:hypothetical protein HYFRA_00009566 [Hymenoscyphus fraxineus]